MQVFTAQPAKQELVLFQLIAANMNITTDQAFTKLLGFTNFLITRIRALNSSGSLTTAAGGIYTGAAKAGNAIVAAGQAYATLTGATIGMDLTIAAVGNGLQTVTPILSLTTGQGSAMTCDMYIIGVPLT
jgi:hypothetical protein